MNSQKLIELYISKEKSVLSNCMDRNDENSITLSNSKIGYENAMGDALVRINLLHQIQGILSKEKSENTAAKEEETAEVIQKLVELKVLFESIELEKIELKIGSEYLNQLYYHTLHLIGMHLLKVEDIISDYV